MSVGTMNFDNRSLALNEESTLMILDSAAGQRMEVGFLITPLDAKTREPIALAVAVTWRCDGCITTHVHAAKKQGATAEEIAEALGVASQAMTELERNKHMVTAFYDLMFNQADPVEAVRRYVGAEYRQHNPMVADGKAAFIEYLTTMF